MTPAEAMPDRRTVESAVALSSRAPSLHNSQPWRWILGADALTLYTDNDRILPATDPSGRQMVLSCGAALDHVQRALATERWCAVIERIPHSPDQQCLAALHFRRVDEVSDVDVRLAAAIPGRRTERLPMDSPPQWQQTVGFLQELVEEADVHLDEISEHERPALAGMSRQLSGERRSDPAYQSELRWWTGHAAYPDGLPAEALPDPRWTVATEREFPAGRAASDTVGIEEDRAAILLLSTTTDSRLDWLRCGEALSAVLLACTYCGLATCPVTHLTESAATRTSLASLAGGDGVPQVLIRVGMRTPTRSGPTTPRRPLSEVLFRERPGDARS
ncbi:Acg family FMN-binding oxidoreductase [Rhodococcus artemisiae]|nr:hypothetical protein [Rhodococcus artemisiae]